MVKLGDKVRDIVSGFEGIAVGRHEYMNGCTRITVQPKVDKDGKLPAHEAFDEPQLEILSSKIVKQGSRNTGGPLPYRVPEARPTGKK